MSRGGKLPILDHEPRAIYSTTAGPPPAYRSGTMETDTWSQYSGTSSGLGKRRSSWTNLIESDENLNKHKVNCYPKVQQAPYNTQHGMSTPSFGNAMSRASSQMAHVSEVYQYHAPRQSLPVLADPSSLPQQYVPQPAGTISQMSRAPPGKPPVPSQHGTSMASNSPVHYPLTKDLPPKRNRLQDCKAWCSRPLNLICLVCIALVLVIAIVVAIVLSQVLPVPSSVSMSWLPPEALRTGGQNAPTKMELTTDDQQIRLQTQGAIPLKGNYVSYYDFKTNRVAVVDQSLQTNGKNLACFILPLDRSNLRDGREMRKAANAAKDRTNQTQGWGESWAWLPSPLQTPPTFEPPIKECQGARWIQLDYASTNQKSRKCTDCHDFCLPDFGIEHDAVRDQSYLNILKRNCFYLFVPEWRTYAQANTMEQNQRDFEQYYRNRNHLATSFGGPGGESKWIPLSVPQTIMNATNSAINAVGNAVGAARTSIFGTSGQQGNMQNMPQNMQNSNIQSQGAPYGMPSQSGVPTYGMNPLQPDGVVGVVNLPGVNGNNGNAMNNMYNTANSQPYQNMNSNSVGSSMNSGNTDPYRSYGQSSPTIPISGQMNGFGAAPYVTQQQGTVTGQNNEVARTFSGYVPDVAPASPQLPYATNFLQNGQSGYQNPYGNPSSNTNNGNNNNNNNGQNGNGQQMGYSIGVGEDRRPSYPDSNGVNPPGGYIPQVQQQTSPNMGVAGMALPASGSRSGYTPDIQQQQQQQPNGRWVSAG